MITRRTFSKLGLALAAGSALFGMPALAQDKPAPFDKPGDVKIALVRYLSTGDFFQAYLAGVESQAKALGVQLQVFDSRQDAALQADMVDQAIALGVQGIIIQHGLTESMKEAAQRAVDAGIKVVAFDVNVENDKIPQIEQSDRDLARLALEQAIKDNGESWKAGYVYVAGIAPLDRRNETWVEFKKKYPGINEAAMFGTLDNPIANSVANQARSVVSANPDITVMFAPYDEFAKGVKIAVVGQVSVRALAMLLAGEDPGKQVIVPPTLITQKDLNDNDIKNMEELSAKLPQFAHADVAMPAWMPNPNAK
jgi:simple sugar transport system substrate-binding protein